MAHVSMGCKSGISKIFRVGLQAGNSGRVDVSVFT